MPRLRAFGVRFLLSSDDLVLPGVLGSIFCATWFGLVLAALVEQWRECNDANSKRAQQVALGSVLAANLLCHLALAWSSGRGTSLQAEKRALVVPLLHAILLLYCALLGLNIWGTVTLKSSSSSDEGFSCLPGVDAAVTWGVWAGVGAAALASLLLLALFGRDTLDSWAAQVACCKRCVCAYSDHARTPRETAMVSNASRLTPTQQIAYSMHLLFGQEDFVWSDYLLGVSLVGIRQRMENEGQWKARPLPSQEAAVEEGRGQQPSGEELEPASEQQASVGPDTLEAALRYQAHAIAGYGWAMHIWANRWGVHRSCHLCCGRGCGCASGMKDIFQPSSLGLHLSRRLTREAILRWTAIQGEDLLFVSDLNEVEGLVPYYLSADHQRKEVVLCVRGTWSVVDFLTDLDWEPVTLDGRTFPGAAPQQQQCENGSGPKKASWSDPITSNTSFYCHRGMFQCTKAVLAHAEPVLTKIFHDGAPAHPSRSPGEAAHAAKVAVKCQGYRLVLTGHSMGAGVAVILGALLRPQFPDLAVWAFSPPGGFVSPELSKATEAFCVSIVTRKDMMSRVSIANLIRLRDEAVELLALCKRSKASVLLRSLAGPPWQFDGLFHESVPDDVRPILSKCQEKIKAHLEQTAGVAFERARSLVVPGKVLYIQEDGTSVGSIASSSSTPSRKHRHKPRRQYVGRWVSPQEISRPGMLVARSMFLDHTPDRQRRILQKALDRAKSEACPAHESLQKTAPAAQQPPSPPVAVTASATAPPPPLPASVTASAVTPPPAVSWSQNPLSP